MTAQYQASEIKHFHTNSDMELLAEACPDITRMIFKYNPHFFTNYIQLAMFEKLTHFETWGGEYWQSGLGQLLEILGSNLIALHLCHVEEISEDSLIHITSHCVRLNTLVFENCSFLENEELTEEEQEIKEFKVPLMLDLKKLRVINFMSTRMIQMILKKAINISTIEIDSENEFTDETVALVMQSNKLAKLEDFLIYSSK